jgi:hypothetical protein
MDEISKNILVKVGIEFDNAIDNDNTNNTNNNNKIIEDQLILRDPILDNTIYNSIKTQFPNLKQIFSSSLLTSLHKEAGKNQKWPLLNLVRQILNVYGYNMKPIRKSDGYTADGVKKFKRFFQIVKKIESVNQKGQQDQNQKEDEDQDQEDQDQEDQHQEE